MRVLMVTPRYLPEVGGVETHVRETARRLAARGDEVAVLCTDLGGRFPPRERIDGVEVVRVPAHPRWSDVRAAPGLGRTLRPGAWDVVHVQSYHTLVAPHAMLAARRARVPYVLTFHAGGHSSRLRNLIRPAQLGAMRPLLAGAARLIALADFEIARYGKLLHLGPERFTTVPNGADLPELAPAERPPVDPGLVLSVGRLERYKGHHRAIEALPHLLRARPDARLRIAGEGPYRAELERLAARLGVAGRVEIRAVPPAERTEMARLIASAAAVVLLSEFETHPIAAIEAAALGRPVLVADTTGLAELAERGLAATVPLDASPSAIANAIIDRMTATPDVPHAALPTWEGCVDGLQAVYREVARPG